MEIIASQVKEKRKTLPEGSRFRTPVKSSQNVLIHKKGSMQNG